MLWSPGQETWQNGLLGLGRGCALFVGAFTLLNLIGEWRHPGFDATLWWIDLRWLNSTFRWCGLILSAALCLRFAIRPGMSLPIRWIFWCTLAVLFAVCVSNAFAVWQLQRLGQIRAGFPVPFSVLVSGLLFLIAVSAKPGPVGRQSRRTQAGLMLCGVFGCTLLFTLGQMVCFGCTDYRRPADVAVVFGCRVFADGTPSHALHDRVRTAAELYRDGLVRRLLLSGGPGDGDVHETAAMRRLAIEFGVDPQDILLDPDGLNTEATVRNSLRTRAGERTPRLLAVSHFYHLPRVKLCYHRAGAEVYTVPAREDYLLRGLARYMGREIVALLWYYIAPAFP